jgi:phage tail-like protein
MATDLRGAPPSASVREYLRSGVPAVYRESNGDTTADPFAMRFLEALERVLDPIVTTTELLPAHLDLEIAPRSFIELVAAWLGVELDAALTPAAHVRLVRAAMDLSRVRGTRGGLERTLALAFDRRDFEVRDSGSATWQGEPPAAAEPTLTVRCPWGLDARTRAAVRRVAEEVTPAHVRLVLLTAEGEPA